MRVKNLDHLNLSVSSFDETTEWYSRVFGFEVVEEAVENGTRWGVIRAGDAMLCIYEHPKLEYEGSAGADRRGVHSINHFGLRISDPEAFEAAVRREGVEVRYGGAVQWPHSTSWYVVDPTGHEIEVALWQNDAVTFATD